MALGPGFGGVTTPEQVDMLPLSPAAKAAWKAKLAPPAPAPPPAPVPPLMGLSPNATALFQSAPSNVQSALTPVDPVANQGGPDVAGQGIAGQVKKGAWIAGYNTEDTPGLGQAPRPTPASVASPGGVPAGGPGLPAPPMPSFAVGGGGGPVGPADNPTGYGLPPPAIDQMAQKKATVLLPGQDAQQQHEQAFLKSQAAKDAELANIKVTAQEKIAAEQAGAVEAYAQASAQEAKERADFSAYYDGEMAKLQATSDRLANAKVDSMRVFKQEGIAGVFQAISVAFAMYAGVKGAAATGGQNAGVMAIDKAIERDVAAQEKDLARQEAGLARSNSLLAQKYRIFGDMQMAKAAAKLDAWKIAGMRADVIAQQSGSEAAKVAAGKVAEAADRGIAKAQEDWNIGIEAKWKQYQAQQAQAAAAAQAAQAAEMKKRDAKVFEAQLEVAKKRAGEIGGSVAVLDTPKKLANGNVLPAGSAVVVDAQGNIDVSGTEAAAKSVAVPTVAGFNAEGKPMYGQASLLDKGDKKVWDDQVKSYSAIKQELKIIEDLRKKHGGGALSGIPWNAQDRKKAEAAASRIHGLLKGPAMLNLGAVSGTDMNFLTSQVPAQPLDTAGPLEAATGQDPIGTQLKDFEASIDNAYKTSEATYLKGGAAANSAMPVQGADVQPVTPYAPGAPSGSMKKGK